MKKARYLYHKIFEMENLEKAWERVQKGRRYHAPIVEFRRNFAENLIDIRNELKARTWTPEPCRTFMLLENKRREIQAPSVRDRVVYHAILAVLEEYFEARFISDSYACRKNKGTHAASYRLREFLRSVNRKWGHAYIVQCDISKYFQSINHELLLQMLPKVIEDEDILGLFEKIVVSGGINGRGLPLGCLTSQWLANLYLDSMDHYVKDLLGIKYYIRYMDDFIVICRNRLEAKDIMAKIHDFVRTRLALELNPKSRVFPVTSGIDFVGYRHWVTHTIPRKRTVHRARKAIRVGMHNYYRGIVSLRSVTGIINSFFGYTKHCSAATTILKIIGWLRLRRNPDAESDAVVGSGNWYIPWRVFVAV